MGIPRTAAAVALVVLGLAPAASGHGLADAGGVDAGDVTHRDTPAELADANIHDASPSLA